MIWAPTRARYLLLFVGCIHAPSWAVDWQVNYDQSRLGFIASYDEIEFDGRFEEFVGDIDFDPEAIQDSSFNVSVVISSVNSDSPDRDEGMLMEDWFDAQRYPNASFVSSGFEKADTPDAYRAGGDLTIKGISAPVVLDFTWTRTGDSARLRGRSAVKRTDFAIGTGDWETDDTIGFDVTIVFDLEVSLGSE